MACGYRLNQKRLGDRAILTRISTSQIGLFPLFHWTLEELHLNTVTLKA